MADEGTWKVNNDGTVTYVPAKGETDTQPTADTYLYRGNEGVTIDLTSSITLKNSNSHLTDIEITSKHPDSEISIDGNHVTYKPTKSTNGEAVKFVIHDSAGNQYKKTVIFQSDQTSTANVSGNDTSTSVVDAIVRGQDNARHEMITSAISLIVIIVIMAAMNKIWRMIVDSDYHNNADNESINDLKARWDSALITLNDARAEWLSYENDIRKFLSAPSMRDPRDPNTEATIRTLQDAEDLERTGFSPARNDEASVLEAQVARFESAVTEFSDNLATAIYSAEQMARNGLDPKMRENLEKARDALAIALDGNTPEGERRNALRAVEVLIKPWGVEVPKQATKQVLAAIEARTPVASIAARTSTAASLPKITPAPANRVSLGVTTASSILEMLKDAEAGPVERRNIINSRIMRAGEAEVNTLCDLIGVTMDDVATVKGTTSANWMLHADSIRIHNAVENVRSVSKMLTELIDSTHDLEVATMARTRRHAIDELITVGEQALSVPLAAH